jgi:hypothetical protein
MKNLIVLLVLFIPFSFFAQVTPNLDKVKIDDKTIEWMTKIASDSELRSQMMTMMIDKTKGNKVEMTKLVNSLMDNPDTKKTMQAVHPDNSESNNISIEPRGMSNDSKKEMKMISPVLKK